MATELIADVGTSSREIPVGMALNPVFDWMPFLGIPIWVYITFLFILLFVSVIVYWMLRIGRLNSVKGWAESLRHMTQEDVQVWVISRVQKLTIECMTIKDNILSPHDPTNISMWHVNSAQGIIRVGGCTAVVISEDINTNRDFITEIALTHNSDAFNANLDELRDRVKQKVSDAQEQGLVIQPPKLVSPIDNYHSYENYGRVCLHHLYPQGLEMPAYNIFDPNRLRKYFPGGRGGMFFGGRLIYSARNMNMDRTEKGFWSVHAILAAAVVIGMIGICAAWLFPMGA